MANTNVTVKQDEEQPIEREVLAEAIVRIGSAMSKLLTSGINKRAVIVLLHDLLNAKVGKRDIELVLNALPALEHAYCKKGK